MKEISEAVPPRRGILTNQELHLELEQHHALHETWKRPAGFLGWLSTTNHKELGLRFIVTAFIFFLCAGLLALAMRLQLAAPELNLLSADRYNQFFTSHGTAMMFLFAVPIMEAIGIYFVPLMLGTRNAAFPRLMNFSYYVFLFSGVTFFALLFLDMAGDQGWFSYVPLAGPSYSPGKRVDLWLQVVTMLEISTLAMATEVVATVFMMRAPFMSLHRIPLFVWSQLITAFMIIFAMPAVVLCSLMLELDRLGIVGTHYFNPAEGGDALLWQHLFWIFGHPEVYIIFIPATGIVSAILPVFCRRPIFGYIPLVLSMVAVAFIGFGVWVHHMFTTPLPKMGQGLFTASSLLITIPNGVQFFCWLATIGTGKLYLKTPLLFVVGFFLVFVIGGLTGVMVASVALDSQVHDTYFVVAHFHYVLIGGALFPLFAAFYYWFPKWTGRMLSETAGVVNAVMLFIGFNVTFFPMHQLGLQGMPRRVYTYHADTGWGGLNLLATGGAFLIGLSVLILIGNAIYSYRRGRIAGPDPWGAGTLEWSTTSPPPEYNFLYPPAVGGLEPLWEAPERTPVIVGLRSDLREMLATTANDAKPHHRYEMSGDSIIPFALAVVMVATVLSLNFHPAGIVIGTVAMVCIMLLWFWRELAPEREHPPRQEAPEQEVPSIDASEMPSTSLDSQSPPWWGGLSLVLILTSFSLLLAGSYFYIMRNFEQWPPPQVHTQPTLANPLPSLTISSLNLLLLLLSCVPMYWVSRAAGGMRQGPVRLGLIVVALAGLAAIVLRVLEFPGLWFRWDHTAYGSIVWGILGLHLLFMCAATIYVAALAVWVWRYSLDEKHARDVRIMGMLWFWLAGVWVLFYAIVYWSPRLL